MPKLTLFHQDFEYSDKVILVEDDEADYELTKMSFQDSLFENELVWLNSGSKLIHYLTRQNEFEKSGHNNPLLIFLDINMPGLNGKETLEKLKKIMDVKKLRIVVLSNADQDHIQSLQLQDYPYIQKPLNFDNMYEYVMNSKHFLFQ